jgi:DNA-binding transcriptional regulator YhcF (GntR family)
LGFITINNDLSVSKKKQIIQSVERAIESQIIKKGDKLPSINRVRMQFSLSRDTVLDAYAELKSRGIIQSVVGKGYYLVNEQINTAKRIFLLFDELNAFKENLYNSFVNSLQTDVEVDIFFHHFNHDVFRNTIINNLGDYSHYVIMPANLDNLTEILGHLPSDKVYLLDQTNAELSHYPAIYQNFEKGVFEGLQKISSRISTYKRCVLVFDDAKQPLSILRGFKAFCHHNQVPFKVLHSNEDIDIHPNYAYMTLDDSSLISIVKQAKEKNLQVNKEIGIVSYNDSPLKEIIGEGVTTISTDFGKMGERLAQMIENNEKESVESEITLTKRKSI